MLIDAIFSPSQSFSMLLEHWLVVNFVRQQLKFIGWTLLISALTSICSNNSLFVFHQLQSFYIIFQLIGPLYYSCEDSELWCFSLGIFFGRW